MEEDLKNPSNIFLNFFSDLIYDLKKAYRGEEVLEILFGSDK